jgi:hypothetical protein
MSTTVEITLGDDGKITVGIADQPSSTQQQPAGNVAEALAMAKHILSAPPAANSPGGVPDSGASPGGTSDAPGSPPGGVAGASDSSGAVASDPKAIWDQLAQAGQPTH